MGMIDPNTLGPLQGPQGPDFAHPVGGEGETDTQDSSLSTLSKSQSLFVELLAQLACPILRKPNYDTINGINAMVGAAFARIGSEMWDNYIDHLEEQKKLIIAHYIDHLEEQKKRIIAHLNSGPYIESLKKTMGGQERMERTMRGKVHNELNVLNATDYNMHWNRLIQNTIGIWSNTIDGVANYIRENRDDNFLAASVVVASFAITSTYIGNYLNIVDVASTDMVTVNPIQNSVSNILPLVPQQLQEQFTMVINLFAIGLIYYSNAEAILKTGQEQQRPPSNWESVVTFAHQVLDKVKGNMVNAYLMAMLINNVEDLGPTQEQREATISKLAILAKAMMISVAVVALLKAESPNMRINGSIFTNTMKEKPKGQSEDDQRVVNELIPLIDCFNQLREESLGTFSEEFWNNLMAALGYSFDDNPDVEDLISPTTIYSKLAKELFNNEIPG